MQHILIVEDNKYQLEMLIHTVSNQYPSWTISYAKTYDEALKLLRQSVNGQLFDLFLLDINLSEDSIDRGGFLLAEEIRKIPAYYRTSILFLTGIYDDSRFALANFHCYNYITKPYTAADILNQLEQMLTTGYLEKSFTIIDTDRIMHKVKCADIIYVQSIRHLKTIYLKGSYICTRGYSMEELISLTDNELIMCHKGYLINPKYISSVDKLTKSVIVNGESIPLGRKYIEHIYSYIENNH